MEKHINTEYREANIEGIPKSWRVWIAISRYDDIPFPAKSIRVFEDRDNETGKPIVAVYRRSVYVNYFIGLIALKDIDISEFKPEKYDAKVQDYLEIRNIPSL